MLYCSYAICTGTTDIRILSTHPLCVSAANRKNSSLGKNSKCARSHATGPSWSIERCIMSIRARRRIRGSGIAILRDLKIQQKSCTKVPVGTVDILTSYSTDWFHVQQVLDPQRLATVTSVIRGGKYQSFSLASRSLAFDF